jgi:antitoxin FitA
MATLVQIREVPDEVHRTLKARAALAGQSLSEYLRTELERIAERPSAEELRARLATRERVDLKESPARTIGRLRERGE